MTQYSLTSLNAVTSDSTGSVLSFDEPVQYFSIEVTNTGTFTSAPTVYLETSLDGTNYAAQIVHSFSSGGPPFQLAATMPSLYARARIISLTGTGGIITAIIAAVPAN